MTLHAVCRTSDIKRGQMKAFEVEGHKIVIYNLADGFFATQGFCTHVFAPLARGKIIEGRMVQCPFHRARFDIRTGKVCEWASFPPGIQVLNVVRGEKALKTYHVTVKDGQVHVKLD